MPPITALLDLPDAAESLMTLSEPNRSDARAEVCRNIVTEWRAAVGLGRHEGHTLPRAALVELLKPYITVTALGGCAEQ